MEEFDVAPSDAFIPAQALERMLKLLSTLYAEVTLHKENLLFPTHNATHAESLDEAYPAALSLAQMDLSDLMRLIQTIDFSLSEKARYRLSGPLLRFKMLAIQAAIAEAADTHPHTGHPHRRDWQAYRRALITAFEAMDTPLDTVTALVNGPRGALAFKRDLQALMKLKSGPAT